MESRTLKSLVHIVESVAARSFGSVFEVNDWLVESHCMFVDSMPNAHSALGDA